MANIGQPYGTNVPLFWNPDISIHNEWLKHVNQIQGHFPSLLPDAAMPYRNRKKTFPASMGYLMGLWRGLSGFVKPLGII